MKKIGLLIPCRNLTVEYELLYLYNIGFFSIERMVCYSSKLNFETSYIQNKLQFLNEISQDEGRGIEILKSLDVDYVFSFCTSASVIGHPMINNPADQIVKYAKENKVSKCFLITPYDNIIGNCVKNFILKAGIQVEKNINLDLLHTNEYFEFGMTKLKDVVIDNYFDQYGHVIISCTNLPTVHIIGTIQKKIKCKVLSSNFCQFAYMQAIQNGE